MTSVMPAPRAVGGVEQTLAAIQKGQQLAGHYPDAEDMERARRILEGELTPEAARAEVRESLAQLVEQERVARRR